MTRPGMNVRYEVRDTGWGKDGELVGRWLRDGVWFQVWERLTIQIRDRVIPMRSVVQGRMAIR